MLYSVPVDKMFTDIISCHLNAIAELHITMGNLKMLWGNISEPATTETQSSDHSSEKQETVNILLILGHQCKHSLLYHWLFQVNHIPILSISFLLKLKKLIPFKKSSILLIVIFRYWRNWTCNHKNKGVMKINCHKEDLYLKSDSYQRSLY